jgi:hypothetical protein
VKAALFVRRVFRLMRASALWTRWTREKSPCLGIRQSTHALILGNGCLDIGKQCYRSQVQALQGDA